MSDLETFRSETREWLEAKGLPVFDWLKTSD